MTIDIQALAEEAAREWMSAAEKHLDGGSPLSEGPRVADFIARALEKLRRQMRPYNGQIMSVQEHDEIVEKLHNDLGALQLQFELRGEIIERLTQERDMVSVPRYEAQIIADVKGEPGTVNYRVTDKISDSRVATCYLKENAELVVRALNLLAAAGAKE